MSNKDKEKKEVKKIQGLPVLIRDLGLAVAEANDALLKANSNVKFTIPAAEIEVKIVLTESQERKFSVEGGTNLKFVNLNASYCNKYGFSQESSSSIKVHLKAIPPEENEKEGKEESEE